MDIWAVLDLKRQAQIVAWAKAKYTWRSLLLCFCCFHACKHGEIPRWCDPHFGSPAQPPCTKPLLRRSLPPASCRPPSLQTSPGTGAKHPLDLPSAPQHPQHTPPAAGQEPQRRGDGHSEDTTATEHPVHPRPLPTGNPRSPAGSRTVVM